VLKALKKLKSIGKRKERKTFTVEILEFTPSLFGSIIKFKTPSGKVMATTAFKFESVEEAIREFFRTSKSFHEWISKGFEVHKKYEGKKIEVEVEV